MRSIRIYYNYGVTLTWVWVGAHLYVVKLCARFIRYHIITHSAPPVRIKSEKGQYNIYRAGSIVTFQFCFRCIGPSEFYSRNNALVYIQYILYKRGKARSGGIVVQRRVILMFYSTTGRASCHMRVFIKWTQRCYPGWLASEWDTCDNVLASKIPCT